MRPVQFLGNNALMMVSAFVLAMLFGGFPEAIPGLTNGTIAMLSLMAMMSFSLCNLQLRGLKVTRHNGAITRAFFLSFILSTGTTIAMAFLFQGDIRNGWILEAAVPSAVSVIPFCYLLRGELEATLVSSAALYFIALALTPVLTLLFIGQAVSPLTLLYYVGTLILVPMVLSRPIRMMNLESQTRHAAINIAFFVLVIAVAGANRQVFFGEPVLLTSLIIVAAVRTFGIGIAWNELTKRGKVAKDRRVPEVLFATHKNTGMAAALAIALLGAEAAVPATVCMSVDIVWLIYVTKFMFPVQTG